MHPGLDGRVSHLVIAQQRFIVTVVPEFIRPGLPL
jgi:hypothetical protein